MSAVERQAKLGEEEGDVDIETSVQPSG